MTDTLPDADLKQHPWRRRYATSQLGQPGETTNLLRAFYVPALLRTIRYDRVAGYFRSSALAAASRGFTALLERAGKVRLIAGCDLAAHDVQAILDGHTERLERHLEAELDKLDEKPERVRRGVTLLAHMVAQQRLDIKVAFRRHAETGEPLCLEDSSDGYVHEKWGILTDRFGNKLSFSGSMNESAAALERNAENIVTTNSWSGEADAQDITNLEHSFQSMWGDNHPHFVVRPIPQAIQEKLIRISEGLAAPTEIDGNTAQDDETVRPSPMEWLRFACIRYAPKMKRGETVGIYTAPVKPWPHQEIIARRLVNTYPYGYLLCDEVGLGKTIENGLAFRALWLSGKARRILICPPASLVTQWQSEMREKFLMPFGIARSHNKGAKVSCLLPYEYEERIPSLFARDLLIVSTGLIQRDERLRQLEQSEPFDVVLVDEAHVARRQNSRNGVEEEGSFGKLYKALQQKVRQRARALWLATATPMQLNAVEAYDLADLIGRLGCFASEHSLVAAYYRILGSLAKGHTPTHDEQETLHIVVRRAQNEDPQLWDRLNTWLLRKDPQLNVVLSHWLHAGIWPQRQDDERLLMRLLFAISPLQRVMLRHTRGLLREYKNHNLLDENLPERRICPIPRQLRFRPDEQDAYNDLKQYCSELGNAIGQNLSGQLQSNLGFYLSLLQQRFASSAVAIRNTLRRRLERVEETARILDQIGLKSTVDLAELQEDSSRDEWETDEKELEELIKATLRGRCRDDLAWEQERLQKTLPTYEALARKRPTKTDVLLRVMDDRRRPGETSRYRQTVVFTRYADTLEHLVEVFKASAPAMRLGTFLGKGGSYWDASRRRWCRLEKNRDQIKHLFLQGEIDLLLCTDAAAEGLNLQSADLLINYDLPWNPMKLEQRIGRIDRIGQRAKTVEVLNLATVGSVEEIIYGRLWKRLSSTAEIVGAQQYSMLPLTEDDFARLARDEIDSGVLEQEALQRLEEHRREIRQLEIPPRELYEIFSKELRQYHKEPRVLTLKDIEHALANSTHLQSLGAQGHEINGQLWFEIKGTTSWGGLYTHTALTADQRLYDRGLSENNLPLRFASYGDSAFDNLVKEMCRPDDRPAGVAVGRAERSVDNTTWERIALLAMVRTEAGEVAPCRIQRYQDLEQLQLVPDTPVPQDAIDECEKVLGEELDKGQRAYRQRKLMLQYHATMGNANKAFLYLLAIGMLRSAQARPNVNDPENVNQVIRETENMSEEERAIIYNLGLDVLSSQDKQELIVKLGAEQHKGQWRSTTHFRQAAMSVIKRERGVAKKNLRGELTSSRFIDRLRRRVNDLIGTAP